MSILKSFRIVRRAVVMFGKNKGSQMGAALAYYALFSMGPLLLIAISITGAFFGEQTARDSAARNLGRVMEPQTVNLILEILNNSTRPVDGVLGFVVFGLLLLLGALKIFFNTRVTFCTIWELPPPRGNTLLGILFGYALASLMVVVVSLLFLLLVIVNYYFTMGLGRLQERMPFLTVNWQLLGIASSYIFLTLLLAMIYRILSGGKIGWGHVFYGSFIAALLFSIGKTLLSLYFGYANINTLYGAGGSVVLFLIWINYSAQIMIFGAELIQARRTMSDWL